MLREKEFEQFLKKKFQNIFFKFSPKGVLGSTDDVTAASDSVDGSTKNDLIDIPPEAENMMWTEKYKPRRLRDLVGNNDVVEYLRVWLKDWHDIVFKGKEKKCPKA